MAQFYNELDDELIKFIHQQKIFFTATAASQGRINLSPKGMDTFRIFSPNKIGFLSLTGSGNETAAHLIADGRITVMFTSFLQNPLILRIYGEGRCVYPRDPDWESYAKEFIDFSGARQIFIIDIESAQTSCGYSIPFYEYKGEREALIRWADQKGPAGIQRYWQEKNVKSIDGLPTRILADDAG